MKKDNKKDKRKPDIDFGSRNVAEFEGLSSIPRIIAFDKDRQESYELMKQFISKIRQNIEKEESHLADNQELIKRGFYTDGWYNGRISALTDVLDILIDTVNPQERPYVTRRD